MTTERKPVAAVEAEVPEMAHDGAWHWWDIPWYSRETLMAGVVMGLIFGVVVGACGGLGLAARYASAAPIASPVSQRAASPTTPLPTTVPTPTITMVGWGTVPGEQFYGDANTTTPVFHLRDGMRLYWGERIANPGANLLIVTLHAASDGMPLLPEIANRLNQPDSASGVMYVHLGADEDAYLSIVAANATYVVDVQAHQ